MGLRPSMGAEGIVPDEADEKGVSAAVESWSEGPDPPPPAVKHPSQVDLTGLPKVFGSVFKLKVSP